MRREIDQAMHRGRGKEGICKRQSYHSSRHVFHAVSHNSSYLNSQGRWEILIYCVTVRLERGRPEDDRLRGPCSDSCRFARYYSLRDIGCCLERKRKQK